MCVGGGGLCGGGVLRSAVPSSASPVLLLLLAAYRAWCEPPHGARAPQHQSEAFTQGKGCVERGGGVQANICLEVLHQLHVCAPSWRGKCCGCRQAAHRELRAGLQGHCKDASTACVVGADAGRHHLRMMMMHTATPPAPWVARSVGEGRTARGMLHVWHAAAQPLRLAG